MLHRRTFKPFLPAFLLLLLGLGLAQIRPQGQAKPPGGSGRCNNDGICDSTDTDSCPDCVTQPLVLETTRAQVVTGYPDNRVYQIKYVSGGYVNSWVSHQLTSMTRAITVGDADNDGDNEIVAVGYIHDPGVTQNRILIYEDSSAGDPAYKGPTLGSETIRACRVGDADGDGLNELVLAKNSGAEVFRWKATDYVKVWSSRRLALWDLDIGDADNDGVNEIVLSVWNVGGPTILEYTGLDTWGNERTAESVGISGLDFTWVRDADGAGYQELVGGGNNKRLIIWRFNPTAGSYDKIFLSEDLGGFTAGSDVGDVDGNGAPEVVTGTSAPSGESNNVYIFRYSNGTWVRSDYVPLGMYGCGQLFLADLDGIAADEIVVGHEGYRGVGGGIRIIPYATSHDVSYYFPRGGYFAVK